MTLPKNSIQNLRDNLKREERRGCLNYLLIAPSTILFFGFVFYPIAKTILWSFSQINLNGQIIAFIGLSNFIHLFHDPVFLAGLSTNVFGSSPVSGFPPFFPSL